MNFSFRHARQYATLGVVLTLTGTASIAQEHPLFQDDAVLKAVLTAPIAQAYAQRLQDIRIYYPGQWTYIDADGQTRRLQVSIRTRGNFRREYCNLPPLQLNFIKSEVKGTLFAGQNKLKLVAPCKHGEKYQQYVVLEYLAYRVFEIITEQSFRTRLLRLSYVDSNEKFEPWTDFTYVIEDEKDMADRLGLDRLRLPAIKYRELDHPKTALVQMFQLLIGNNDYSVVKGGEGNRCCHNMEVLGIKDTDSGRIPIPFDFDMSGLVNADYATPPRQVPIEDVRRRYFYGLCQPADVLNDAIAHMQAKRNEIVALFADSAELDSRTKARSLEYVEDFYDLIGSTERTETEIIARCRGRELMEQMLRISTSPSVGQPDLLSPAAPAP